MKTLVWMVLALLPHSSWAAGLGAHDAVAATRARARAWRPDAVLATLGANVDGQGRASEWQVVYWSAKDESAVSLHFRAGKIVGRKDVSPEQLSVPVCFGRDGRCSTKDFEFIDSGEAVALAAEHGLSGSRYDARIVPCVGGIDERRCWDVSTSSARTLIDVATREVNTELQLLIVGEATSNEEGPHVDAAGWLKKFERVRPLVELPANLPRVFHASDWPSLRSTARLLIAGFCTAQELGAPFHPGRRNHVLEQLARVDAGIYTETVRIDDLRARPGACPRWSLVVAEREGLVSDRRQLDGMTLAALKQEGDVSLVTFGPGGEATDGVEAFSSEHNVAAVKCFEDAADGSQFVLRAGYGDELRLVGDKPPLVARYECWPRCRPGEAPRTVKGHRFDFRVSFGTGGELQLAAPAVTATKRACQPPATAAATTTEAYAPPAPIVAAPHGRPHAGVARTDEEVALCRRAEAGGDGGAPQQAIVSRPAVHLRSAPVDLPPRGCREAARRLNFHSQDNPSGCFVNAYVPGRRLGRPGVTADLATGLMWLHDARKAETLANARRHIAELNTRRAGGFGDWRLPTTEELLSILELTEFEYGRHVDDRVVDSALEYWTADSSSDGEQWIVNSLRPGCSTADPSLDLAAPAVRTMSSAELEAARQTPP